MGEERAAPGRWGDSDLNSITKAQIRCSIRVLVGLNLLYLGKKKSFGEMAVEISLWWFPERFLMDCQKLIKWACMYKQSSLTRFVKEVRLYCLQYVKILLVFSLCRKLCWFNLPSLDTTEKYPDVFQINLPSRRCTQQINEESHPAVDRFEKKRKISFYDTWISNFLVICKCSLIEK